MDVILWLVGLTMATLFGSPTATEMVEHAAQQPPAAIYSCDSVTVNSAGDIHSLYVKTTATGGAKVVGYVFDFGGESGLIATRSPYILATLSQTSQREVTVMVLFEIGGNTTKVDTCWTMIYSPGA